VSRCTVLYRPFTCYARCVHFSMVSGSMVWDSYEDERAGFFYVYLRFGEALFGSWFSCFFESFSGSLCMFPCRVS